MKIPLYCRGSLRNQTLDREAIHDSSWSMARIFAVVFLILGSPLSVAEELITLKGTPNGFIAWRSALTGNAWRRQARDKTVRVWDAESGQESLT